MNKKDIIEALNSPIVVKDGAYSNEFLQLADTTRQKNVGDVVHLRALIEFSNYCTRNCLYCGIRQENKNCKRYNLKKEEILKYAKNAIDLGLKTIVLQSGENDFLKTDEICEIIAEIKKFDVCVTLSIGEKSYEEYKAYKMAGADRYLLRIETTNEELYQKMHPHASFKNRLKCLQNLKELNYEVGSGMLIGLPDQTDEMIAEDILFLKNLAPAMVGLGPFIPAINTPLQNCTKGDFKKTLLTLALVRINLPTINIPATTAIETIEKNGRMLALGAGANVVMPNFTDFCINKNYSIYDNKFSNAKGILEALEEIKRQIKSINRIAR